MADDCSIPLNEFWLVSATSSRLFLLSSFKVSFVDSLALLTMGGVLIYRVDNLLLAVIKGRFSALINPSVIASFFSALESF